MLLLSPCIQPLMQPTLIIKVTNEAKADIEKLQKRFAKGLKQGHNTFIVAKGVEVEFFKDDIEVIHKGD